MPDTLFLKLEGPLQAWGERARWSVRDTAPEPSKSGVVGLLGCSLGVRSDDELRRISGRLVMGVRVDRAGEVIRDFHTIVDGVMSAEGKIKRNATTKKYETVVTVRGYLSDACFTVALQSEDSALLDQLEIALQNPVWPIFLGRKSCPPSRPVLAGRGDYLDLKTALIRFPLDERSRLPVRMIMEAAPGEGTRRRDEVYVNSLRRFLPRYTRSELFDPKPPLEV